MENADTSDLGPMLWPLSRLNEALVALSLKSGLARGVKDPPPIPEGLAEKGEENLDRWIEAVAASLNVEAEPVESTYADVEGFLRHSAPSILRIERDGKPHFLVILKGASESMTVIAQDLDSHLVPVSVVRSEFCRTLEEKVRPFLDQVLEEAEIVAARRSRVQSAILREHLRPVPMRGCWLLRLSAGAPFGRLVHDARLIRRFSGFLVVYVIQMLLWLASWWMIGRAALEGHIDRGWLIAWALVLVTLIPFRSLSTWLQGTFAIGMGSLIKRRLLHGTLRLEPEEIRNQGAGQLLGRVIESEAVEALALSGGFLSIVATIELIVAVIILWMGTGGALHALLLLAWTAVALAVGWIYFKRRSRWTDLRLSMTNDLVEQMIGHRTRAAQQQPEARHEGEDQTLQHYLDTSKAVDRIQIVESAVLSNGWLIVAVVGLVPAFVSGEPQLAGIATALGGIMQAQSALGRLTMALSHLTGAAIAWRQVGPLFKAADRPLLAGSPEFALVSEPSNGKGQTLLEATDIVFRYPGRSEPALRGCTIQVRDGDRLLLEGPSGGGKSTLASTLIGMRTPQSGLILLRGLDRHTLGSEGWMRRAVAAPQFHENHVFTGTFAFNLLMGGRWPPYPEEMQEAEEVCRELGLGEVLDRMPSGLLQMVGETGWQLSHGERSRLFIARALLEKPELVVLDESFAALDPENLKRALECVLKRARTVLVIAHP